MTPCAAGATPLRLPWAACRGPRRACHAGALGPVRRRWCPAHGRAICRLCLVNDQRIEKLTGQPFSEAYRDKILGAPSGRFDSGPATLALTAAAQTAPDRELDVLHALQRARYVDGRDTADAQVLADVLRSLGLPDAAAQTLAPDAALHRAMDGRVASSQATLRAVGARGVPQLVVRGRAGRSG